MTHKGKRGQTYRHAHTVTRGGKTFKRKGSKVNYWQGAGQKVGTIAAAAVVGIAAFSLSAASAMARGLFVAAIVGVAASVFAWSEWNARQRRNGMMPMPGRRTETQTRRWVRGWDYARRGDALVAKLKGRWTERQAEWDATPDADEQVRREEAAGDRGRRIAAELRRRERTAAAERTNTVMRDQESRAEYERKYAARDRVLAAQQRNSDELAKDQLDDDDDDVRITRLAANVRRAGGK